MTDRGATLAPINLDDYETLARERLQRELYEFFAGGAGDEVTLRGNRDRFEAIAIRPRVLVDVSERALATTALGTTIDCPVLIAPTAYQRMAHPEGELATARAAKDAGTIMVMSTAATSPVADVSAVGAPLWFQLYVYRDRTVTVDIVHEAEARGCRALVLTVDTPMVGRRERDVRNRFVVPDAIRRLPGPVPQGEASIFATHFTHPRDEALTWRDIDWLASHTTLPIVLKGVLRADDASRAVEHGARALIVSNHGGRQLDSVIATIDALPEVADATQGRVELYLDGGVRRGTDVLKALALGARAVLIGRPIVWGLVANGSEGARHVLELLRAELDLAMALSGCPSLVDITRDLVTRPCGPSAPGPR
jgi:4-hydroxymandelate oxidase